MPAFPEVFPSCWTMTDTRLHQSCFAPATHWLGALFAPKTASSLQLQLPLTLQTRAPVRLYILDHPATCQTNKTLVTVDVLVPGLWIVDRKVDLSEWEALLKRLLELQKRPPSLPQLGSQLWIKGCPLAPNYHYRSHHASLLPAEKRWVFLNLIHFFFKCLLSV